MYSPRLRLLSAAALLLLGVLPVLSPAQVPHTLLHDIPAPAVGVQLSAQLGYSVAVDENSGFTVAGVPFDDIGNTDSGVVKVFDTASGELLHLIPNPSPALNDNFGWSVSISGTRLVVGAYGDNTGATNSGSVYVFDLGSTTPTVPVVTINNPNPEVDDRFGCSVSISGLWLVVGAYQDNTGAPNAGRVYVFDVGSSTPTVPFVTINNPSPAFDDRFGCSVSISGMRLVVGAYGGQMRVGSAYVFDLESGAPAVPVLTLNKPSPAYFDYFGISVAISGTRVVVGAYEDVTGATNAGSVYVYELDNDTPTVPVVSMKNPSPAIEDRFGCSVSISGARLVVGAYQDDTGALNAGSAYVYDLGSGTPSVPVATLNNPTPEASDYFGHAVTISGARVVVGAYRDNMGATDAGSAYVYDVDSGTPSVPVTILNNPGPAVNDQFGRSVAISGTRLVVGAYLDDTQAINAGSSYVYDLNSGMSELPVATLNKPSHAASDYFGRSVAISGNRVVVGAEGDDTGATGAGSAYVYDLESATPTIPLVTFNNPDPEALDNFGEAVAISGTRVVVGAYRDNRGATDAGSAYVYDLDSSAPTVPVATLSNPSPVINGYFGRSVAISGTRVVVGAYRGATDAGSAYVYDLDSSTSMVPIITLNCPNQVLGDEFGGSVAISGALVAVGANLDDTGAINAGSVYIYDLNSATPGVPIFTLNNPSASTNDRFGISVAISGTRLVVGAHGEDTGAINSGSAYVYELNSGTPTVPVATINHPSPAEGDSFGVSVALDEAAIAVGVPLNDRVGFNKGCVYVFGFAEMVVSGNGTDIFNGDDTPDEKDDTYFGKLVTSGSSRTRNFSITNAGMAVLSLPSTPLVEISGSAAFSITQQPTSDTVAAFGGTETFAVTFAPTTIGLHTATVSIASDDADANPFTFDVAGVGVVPGKKPTLKLTAPAGNLTSTPLPLQVKGVAGDSEGVDRVEVVLNNSAPVQAVLGASNKTTAVPFSADITPVIGVNTLVVTAYDLIGNATSVTRSFTFEQRFVLSVARGVPVAQVATPDKAGTVSLKAVLAGKASALSKGAPQTSAVLPGTLITVTATAKTEHLFSHWTGLPAGAQVRGNVVSFPMPVADVPGLTAVFVENALSQGSLAGLGAKPVLQGLLRPDGATAAGNGTVGFVNAALVVAKGSLSGKVWMDGKVMRFTGAAHGDGTVWFRVGKSLVPVLPFLGRELEMTWSGSGLALTVTGGGGEVSTGLARPPLYSKDNPVRGGLLDAKGKQGYYTVALPAQTQDPVKALTEYPQGSGRAGLTLKSNGSLRFKGTLAEGAAVTASGFLATGDESEIFIALPTPGAKTKLGSLLGTLVFDETKADSDVSSADMTWFRPLAATAAGKAQAYRAGWPGGIALGLIGAKHDKTMPAQTVLGLTGPGRLVFSGGKLTAAEVEVTNFSVSGNRVTKVPATDKRFSLSFTQGTGFFKGTFTPDWTSAKLPAFNGVLLGKGANRGGWGFFLSNESGDLEPESGAVVLEKP